MMREKLVDFAIKHPFITYLIIDSVGAKVRSTLVKMTYILRTGEMPKSDTAVNEPKPVQQEEEERDKHGF